MMCVDKMLRLNKKTLLVVVSVLATALAHPPCVCNRVKRPVCASNGQTYNNQCLLDCAAVSNPDLTLLRSGACEQVAVADPSIPCFCNFNYAPVCGTDDNTYGNECSLNCARSVSPALNVRHSGACSGAGVNVVNNVPGPDGVGACACAKELKPVCGSNGSTYNNLCLLNCARATYPGLELNHVGRCDQFRIVN